MSTQFFVSVWWEEVPGVEIAVGKRIADANARWNITPCGRVVVQFDGEPVAYRMDPRRAVRALCQARTAEHVQPPDPPARLRPLVGLILALACGLLAGCLSASWIYGVALLPALSHRHTCKPVIGYPVPFCTTCEDPCLTAGPALPRRMA